MEVEALTLRAERLRAELLPLLSGAAFHVTTAKAFEAIRSSGAIEPSRSGSGRGSPAFGHAYSRSRGYVAICDLRSVTQEQVNLALDAYYFLNPFERGTDPTFLLLNSVACTRLIPARQLRADLPRGKLLVPHIEAAYPERLPLQLIAHAVVVTVEHPPLDPFLSALLAARPGPPAT